MNIKIFFLLPVIIVFLSCNEREKNSAYNDATIPPAHTAVQIIEDNNTPTVNIAKYILISVAGEDRSKDAAEILSVKRRWPLAMQSQRREKFESILSKDFTFTGNGELFNREDYIIDRTKPSEWKITNVKYDNLTLQFLGDRALLSYRNEVTNENINTHLIEMEYISWADVYIKEEGKWKISTAHVIDFRMEPK